MAVSFIGGVNQRTQKKATNLPQLTCNMSYIKFDRVDLTTGEKHTHTDSGKRP